MPTLILSNPLGADDAQRIGLDIRPYAVGEQIAVNDFVFATLIRTGYGIPYGTFEDVLLIGSGPPNAGIGVDGQWYLDTLNEILWGPKEGGYWPADPIRPDRGVQQLRVDTVGEQRRLIVVYSTGTQVDLGDIRGPLGPEAPLATASTPGRVQLAGDLGGTATAPTVPGLGLLIPLTQKGAAGGVATLDPGGLIPSAQLPPLAITNTFPVADQAAMLALTAQPGDVAIRADGTGTFILRAEPASTLANWSVLATPVTVSSVDGRTGVVSLGDLYIADTERGAANGVAPLDVNGKVPLTSLPPEAQGGDDAGDLFVPNPAPTGVPLDVTIVSNWGITNAGSVYYDAAGAPEAEAGLLIPDPETNSVAVWRPGAPWADYLDTRVADRIKDAASATTAALNDAYGRDRGTGTAFPAVNLRRGDVFHHTGLACLMVYNGTEWRQVHVSAVADAAARTAISTTYSAVLHPGFRVRHTDTGNTWEWTGTGWETVGHGGFPHAVLRQTTAQTGLTGYNDITFQTEDIDTHDGHSTATNTHRWTCPAGQAGTYAVQGTFVANNGGGSAAVFARLVKNGTIVPGSFGPGGGTYAGGGTLIAGTGRCLVTLAAGDWVGMQGSSSVAPWGSQVSAAEHTSMLALERIR